MRRRALGRVTGVVVPVFVVEPDAGVAVHGVAQKTGGGLRGVLREMNVVRSRRDVRFRRGIVRRRARLRLRRSVSGALRGFFRLQSESLLGAHLRGLFFFSAALFFLSTHRLRRGRRAHQAGGLAVGHAEDVAVPHELGRLEHQQRARASRHRRLASEGPHPRVQRDHRSDPRVHLREHHRGGASERVPDASDAAEVDFPSQRRVVVERELHRSLERVR